MKMLTSEKVAGFLDRLWGDKEPSASDTALGVAAVGGAGVAGQHLRGALTSNALLRESPDLESVSDLVPRVEKYLRQNKGLTAGVDVVNPAYMQVMTGSGNTGYYNSKPDKLTITPKTPAHITMHEMGHGAGRNRKSVRALNHLDMLKKVPFAGGVAGLALAGSGNEHLEDVAPAAVALMHAPQMLEEGRAWLNADRAIRNSGDVPSEALRGFRRKGLIGLAGYGASAGINAAAAAALPGVIDRISER